MNVGNELDFLREMFKDTRLHVGIGLITTLGLSLDKSVLRVKVTLLPENRDVVALMCFDDPWDVTFPDPDDLAIVAFCDGQDEDAHVIKILNTKDEPIPQFAVTGDSVKYARPGKNLWLGSDTSINLSRPGVDPSEPLVLGTQIQMLLANILDQLANLSQELAVHVHTGVTTGPGSSGIPADAATFTAYKATFTGYKTSPVNDGTILSNLAFTEKGAL